MKAKRKRNDSAFKAVMTLEGLKVEWTIQLIAEEYEVYPVQVTEWNERIAQ